MKTYAGQKTGNRVDVLVFTDAGDWPLRHVVRHSPDGFNWGYGGSGPADLALSILADYFDEYPENQTSAMPALKCEVHYQQFKWDYVCAWGGHWEITEEDIARWLERQTASKAPLN